MKNKDIGVIRGWQRKGCRIVLERSESGRKKGASEVVKREADAIKVHE